MIKIALVLALSLGSAQAAPPLVLVAGFITKVSCEGRLFVSSIGNDTLVRLEALPKELGCAVLLKPLAGTGRTNLILETSSGSVQRLIEIHAAPGTLDSQGFDLQVKGGPQ